MFYFTYLRRELHRRMRQAMFIALGLALGVGLVVTVAAASAGVNKAQSTVLSALYGVGTDVTVTGAPPAPPSPSGGGSGGTQTIGGGQPVTIGPDGQPQTCTSSGKCTNLGGQTVDTVSSQYSGISASKLAEAARLHGVSDAAGGVTLQDTSVTYPKSVAGGIQPEPNSLSLDGVDVGKPSLGPLSTASLTSGHSFTAADAVSDVAVVDSGYARSHGLKAGSVLTIDKVTFTVIGIVSQPQEGGNPPDVYIPLKAAQDMPVQIGDLDHDVNMIYLTAASSADIPAVQKEISGLLPGATVTTASSLASQVTGSVSSAGTLANDLGRWLAVLVLIAAFAVASLLTMSAVARRAREFGTLKAIGWRSRRIVAQVLGESVAIGAGGAAIGVGLGFAAVAIIAAVAPKLSATVGGGNGAQASAPGVQGNPAGQYPVGGSVPHVLSVPLHPSVTVGVIILAAVLAVAGGLLAGALGSWRIAGLRPVDAMARVA
jgi:putative ABC transport system permease protein